MSGSRKVKLGVLVSGRGSNLQAIMDNIGAGRLQAEICVVISDVEDAYALVRARNEGLKTVYVDPKAFGSREEFDQRTADVLKRSGVELVMLAGFMRVLTPVIIRAFPQRIMNIHPALLPSFPGLHVQKKALLHGVKFSGCTVHFVDEGVDTGPIIIQAIVPVLDGDTEDSLSARILKQEHRIYTRAIQLFAEGKLFVQGRRVLVKSIDTPEDVALINPPLE